MKKCIILSFGPVPTPSNDKVEGGGLRCWGLAKGLSNNKNIELTVAYNDQYKKDEEPSKFENINITTWSKGSIQDLIQDFDTIIVSYCMGDLSIEVVESIRTDQQLILDCYVPIYVEISARESDDIEHEYNAFKIEVDRWAKVLKRGDLFLCANDNQVRFYQGVLASLGRINPITYGDELIIKVPYGIYENNPAGSTKPISDQVDNNTLKLLWFGGVYPWFDVRSLIDAVNLASNKVAIKLIIVGAKNPFNAHPDFVKRYEDLYEYIENNDYGDKNILTQDWIDFNDRANWYLDSDLVILVNRIGEENQLAWRTRLVDYIWADLPILTNGGDPLSEELLSANAAIKLDKVDTEYLALKLVELAKNKAKLNEVKTNLGKIRPKYFWSEVTKNLGVLIASKKRAQDFEKVGQSTLENKSQNQNIINRLVSKARKIPDYKKQHGTKATIATLRTTMLNRTDNVIKRKPSIVFLAHQLDATGAPHVFIDMIQDFKSLYPYLPTEFHTFIPANSENIAELNRLGIKPRVHISRDIEIKFIKGDVVVMNTVALSESVRNSVYKALENNLIKKLVWYIHEDEPEFIFKNYEKNRIRNLLKKHKIEIFSAAQKTISNYQEFFGVPEQINKQIYRVEVPNKYTNPSIKPEDFDTLKFILPGMVSDGRKGQLPLIYAFIEFKKRFYNKNPNIYRNFHLTYVGMSNDFLSRQILKHVDKGLGEHFTHHGKLTHKDCFEEVLKSNVTICYSMRECLPMFVYEGMLAGHPLLRNDSSGMEEQLKDGINGYEIPSNDFEGLILTIEKMVNKEKTTNSTLNKMSKESYKIASELTDVKYISINESIERSFING